MAIDDDVFLLTVAVILTAVALARHGSRCKGLVGARLVAISIGLAVVVPMQVIAQEDLLSGALAGSVLQNMGPLGSAIGSGVAGQAAADARQKMATANAIDVVVTLALISVVAYLAFKPVEGRS